MPVGIAFEVDRGTEDQKRWRQKVQALAAFATGSYREAFGLDNLTIAVVGPTPARISQLAAWTRTELADSSYAQLSEIFLFTAVGPTTVSPKTWVFDALWPASSHAARHSTS